MKRLLIFIILLILFAGTSFAVLQHISQETINAIKGMTLASDKKIQSHEHKTSKFQKYVMDNNYFTCQIPSDWELHRNKAEDEEYKIYEVRLFSPSPNKTSITISYYAQDNEDFKDYKNFIERNTHDGIGRKESDIGKYSDSISIQLNGRKAFKIDRELKEYTSLDTKDSESYWLKEMIIVFPASKGFYVLHYSAKKENFQKHLPIFDNIVKSFKPLY